AQESYGDCRLTSPTSDPTAAVMTALDLTGHDAGGGDTETVSSNTVHLSPQAGFASRTLVETAGMYTRLSPLRFPLASEIRSDVGAGSLALAGACGQNGSCSGDDNDASEAKRILGEAQASSATRNMLLDAMAFLEQNGDPDGLLGSYFAYG